MTPAGERQFFRNLIRLGHQLEDEGAKLEAGSDAYDVPSQSYPAVAERADCPR